MSFPSLLSKNQWVIQNGDLIQTPEDTRVEAQTNGKEFSLIFPKGQIFQAPFYLIHLSNAKKENVILYKTQIIAEEQSQATLIECYLHESENIGDLKTNTEILLKKSSRLEHTLWMSGGRIWSQTQVEQAEKSHYSGFLAGLGVHQHSSTIHLALRGIEAKAHCQALLLPRLNEISDLQCCVQHLQPHCQSQITVRSVVADQGKFNFTGKIKVGRDAHNSIAYLENKNILLSREAEAKTCPELEIYNDDIQCKHGATVGHLDENAIFYLKSRGIPEQQAKQLIISGFIQPILQTLKPLSLQTLLTEHLHEY